jgi:hypothetical protein
VRGGVPVEQIADVVRALLAVGVPRRLIEDVSLRAVGAVGLAAVVLTKVDEAVDQGANAALAATAAIAAFPGGTAVTPNGTVLKS